MLVNPRTTLDVRTLENLSTYHPKHRAEAEERLTLLGPKAVDALIHALEDKAVAHRRSRILGYIRGGALMLGAVLAGAYVGGGEFLGDIKSDYFAVMPFSLAYRNAVLALSKYEDVRALPILLRIHQLKGSGIEAECEEAILRLSRLVTPIHAPLFDEQARQNLRSGLHTPKSQFNCALLHIIGEVGDTKDIPIVKELTLIPTNSNAHVLLRQSAIQTLLRLEATLENRRQSQTLLRASSPESQSDTLLRPIGASPAEPTEQLLRPSDT